jgi:hypothetical protein
LELKGDTDLNARDIGTLSFKVLSIYALINGVDSLLYAFRYAREGDSVNVLLNLSPPTSLIAGGILLWFAAQRLSLSIFKPGEFENSTKEISTADLQSIAFSIVGIYILSTALRSALELAALLYGHVRAPVGVEVSVGAASVYFLSKAILGLWLLLGSRGLVNFIRSMKRDRTVTCKEENKENGH